MAVRKVYLKRIVVFVLRKSMRNLTEDSWYQLRVKVSFRDEVRFFIQSPAVMTNHRHWCQVWKIPRFWLALVVARFVCVNIGVA